MIESSRCGRDRALAVAASVRLTLCGFLYVFFGRFNKKLSKDDGLAQRPPIGKPTGTPRLLGSLPLGNVSPHALGVNVPNKATPRAVAPRFAKLDAG